LDIAFVQKQRIVRAMSKAMKRPSNGSTTSRSVNRSNSNVRMQNAARKLRLRKQLKERSIHILCRSKTRAIFVKIKCNS
uniref:Nuclear transcription factor Y subunit n=1 Tax=Anisakis simplex TaxID=6269 RepID=A0A0M3JKR2_ANISI